MTQRPLPGMARFVETERARLIRRETAEDFDRLALTLAELFDDAGHGLAAARMRRVDVFARIRAEVEAAHEQAHEHDLEEAAESARQNALADAADRVSEHLEVARKALVAAAASIENERKGEINDDKE